MTWKAFRRWLEEGSANQINAFIFSVVNNWSDSWEELKSGSLTRLGKGLWGLAIQKCISAISIRLCLLPLLAHAAPARMLPLITGPAQWRRQTVAMTLLTYWHVCSYAKWEVCLLTKDTEWQPVSVSVVMLTHTDGQFSLPGFSSSQGKVMKGQQEGRRGRTLGFRHRAASLLLPCFCTTWRYV